MRERNVEDETGWHADGGRPYGHPDDVMSPMIRVFQLFGMAERDPKRTGPIVKRFALLLLVVFTVFIAIALAVTALSAIF